MYIPEPMTSDEINEMLDYVEQLESESEHSDVLTPEDGALLDLIEENQ